MIRLKLLSILRPLGRVVMLIILGYPYLIIAVPLAAWLLVFAAARWLQPEPHAWTFSELLNSVGLTVGAVLFALLALLHLAAMAYGGWKGHADIYRRGSWQVVGRPWLHCMIERDQLLERLDTLGKTHAIIGPVRREQPRCDPPRRFFYERAPRAADLALDFDYTVYGPKAMVLPPRETLFKFDMRSRRFEAVPQLDTQPIVLAGVHPCDIHAVRLLDEVFSRDYADQHYQKRRENTMIVGVDCEKPCSPDAFCRDMATNEAELGFDVMLYPLDERTPSDNGCMPQTYGVVFGSDAGRKWLLANDGAAIHWPTTDDERRFERYLQRKSKVFPTRLTTVRREIPAVLSTTYNSLVWEATARRCYSCGSCNLVCPTCYCFDIQERNDLPPVCGERERTWDSCMLRDFALVAGGHNFRSGAAGRLRHRIHRKAAWIERRTGMPGCVGCGRCERACTAHISIVEILNQLAQEDEAADQGRVGPASAPAGAAL